VSALEHCAALEHELLIGNYAMDTGGSDQDIEDRRDDSSGGAGGSGHFMGVHLGIGGTLLVRILSLVFHQNLFSIFSGSGPAPASPSSASQPYEDSRERTRESAQEKPEYEFIKLC